MKKINKLTALALTAIISVQTAGIAATAEEAANPDLAALAAECGYGTDTFQFTNYIYADRIPEEIFDEEYERISEVKFSNEEQTHGKVDLYYAAASGSCYAMSAIPVLVHNGAISAADLQDGAESLYDVTFDETVGRYILQYTFAQVYHDVQLATSKEYCISTAEERVAELLATAKRCQESGRYFQIVYSGIRDDRYFGHGVVGIGMAEGNWTINGLTYDTCILTYDSNRANAEDTSIAGEFTEKLCIFINSETNKFCIPGYKVSSDNGGDISYATDSSELLNFRSEINGTDTVGEDISGLAQMFTYGSTKGIATYAQNESGEYTEITDVLSNMLTTTKGHSYFTYPSTVYRIEQNNAAEYFRKEEDIKDDESGIYGAVWGQGWCTRYGAGDGNDCYNYSIDIARDYVTITNEGLVEAYNDNDGEMDLVCALSHDGEYYYYFMGAAADGESVTMIKNNEDVIITSNDGSLKGTLLARKTDTATGSSAIEYTINAKNSVYVDMEDMELTVSIDKDGDGIYETPLEQGDANGDGEITLDDASEVLKFYAESGADLVAGQVGLNLTYPLSLNTADLNGDEKIDISDATEILSKYARKAAGLK